MKVAVISLRGSTKGARIGKQIQFWPTKHKLEILRNFGFNTFQHIQDNSDLQRINDPITPCRLVAWSVGSYSHIQAVNLPVC